MKIFLFFQPRVTPAAIQSLIRHGGSIRMTGQYAVRDISATADLLRTKIKFQNRIIRNTASLLTATDDPKTKKGPVRGLFCAVN